MKSAIRNLARSLVVTTSLMTNAAFADDAPPAAPANDPAKPIKDFKVTPELNDVPIEEIETAYEGRKPPEAIRMFLAIKKGSQMGANDGWFGPAAARYNWAWLAQQHGIELDDGIEADKFQGPINFFPRFDRNRDGVISAEDLDWSDRNPWIQQAYMANRLFRKIDPNGDGKLSREDWMAFFDKVSGGKNELTSEELREAWLAGMSSFLPGDGPTPEILLRGLFAGEVGSLQEGPQLNEPAPDFTLKTHDGTQTIRLADVIGKKPVVIVFGNFTCGPFRSMYPGVEDVYRRFKDDVVFLGVYVREAHPTDGWKMDSNAKVGIEVAQPKTYGERSAVATKCHALLKPTIPLLVDEIDDSTGNAYSGMPARLYVIDTAGRVAYKSGRGPFGFKTGEMEQALLMTLLDQKPVAESPGQKPADGSSN